MFNDPEMNAILEKNKDLMVNHIKFLNALSHDIRQLNEVLLNSAIPGEVILPVEWQEESFIVWDGKQVIFSSPDLFRELIQTPKEIRIKCKPYLQKFLKLCFESLGEK